jgi:type I restriction enzyme S subunit
MSNDELPKNWDFCPLGEHVQLISGRHVASADWNERGEGVAYLTGPSDFVGKEAVVTKHTTAPKVMCQEGDILITVKGSGCGKVARAQQPACISRQLMAIRPRSNPGFWFQLIADKEAYFERLSAGSAIPGLSQSQILETEVPFPPLPEQRRIADVLDTVDAAIQETDAVVEKQEQVKTGLLQDLLTRGLDADGRLRDPEREPEAFRETELGLLPREWTTAQFEEVARLRHGFQFRSYHFSERGYPVVKIKNVGEDGSLDLSEVSLIPEEKADDFQDVELFEGDLLMSLTGNIGRVVKVPKVSGRLFQNYRVGKFTSRDTENLSKDFLELVLSSSMLSEQVRRKSNKTAQANIGKGEFLETRLPIPPLKEQERTTERVQAHTDTISEEKAYREKLEALKTGLMQDLLTGRVRVPEAEDRVDEVIA